MLVASGLVFNAGMSAVVALHATGALPRALDWLGVAVGALGVLSVVPALGDLAYGFGLLQIAWFAGLGVVMLRRPAPSRAGAARSVASEPQAAFVQAAARRS